MSLAEVTDPADLDWGALRSAADDRRDWRDARRDDRRGDRHDRHDHGKHKGHGKGYDRH